MTIGSLAADGVCLLHMSPYVAERSYRSRFTLTLAGGIVSVALSLGFEVIISRGDYGFWSRLPLATILLCAVRTFLSQASLEVAIQ